MKGRFFILLLFLIFVSPAVSETPLTLSERIQAQEKIERIYYNHRIWPDTNNSPKPPFEQMVPRSVIEQKVINSLRNSSITPKMLQTELDRIAKTTQDPAMLQELFSALNNDPFLIAETLVRPILADRISQSKKSRKEISFRLPEIRSGASCEGWEPLTASNPPSARSGHTAVWTGTEMIVWGGGTFPSFLNTGGRYDPALNTWTPTSTGTNVPSPRFGHTAVWTGTEMIVWGGVSNDEIETNTGGRYDPTTDTWTSTSIATNVPDARLNHTAVWTGSEMIVWGGERCCFDDQLNTGGRYDPSTDTWQPTSMGTDLPSQRSHHTAVWTGNEMIVWGGLQYDFGTNSGGKYDPVSDTWLPTSFDNAPDIRFHHTAIWTGSEMIIWGGRFYELITSTTNTGGRYDPATDTWQATPIIGAPNYRNEHTAAWTGAEMTIWAGKISVDRNMKSGGRYSLNSDNWKGTAIGPNAPSKRNNHTAVWTGTKMIVFGGSDNGSDLDTGGIYDSNTDNIALDPQKLPNGELGTPYFQTISASGGVSPYTLEMAEGSLPTGLTFDGSTGVISGTATDEKSTTAYFAINATDATGCAGGRSYFFFICPVLTFSPPALPPGGVGFFYNQKITVSGGQGPPYIFSVLAGSLPPGLTLDSWGVISGIATTTGLFSFTVNAVDLVTCAKSKDYTIKITTIAPHN